MPIRSRFNNHRLSRPTSRKGDASLEGRRLDRPTLQGNRAWMLPIPATFVVGQDGLIRARFIDPDYRNRMMISDMLAAML